MADKRKDNRGRILKTGETQRADGRYMYQYMDDVGKRKTIYRDDLNELRKEEQKIQRDLQDGIKTGSGEKISLNEMFDLYMSTKRTLKQSTKTNYIYMWKSYVRDDIGLMKLSRIKKSDIIKYYNKLLNNGFKANSLEIIHTLVHPTFTMAVDDGLIRINPSSGVMKVIDKGETKTKMALTEKQQEAFVTFTANNPVYSHWLPLFTFLLGTGCRIGEAIGIRWEDIDFKASTISINHNLIYRIQDNGKCEFHVTTPKTEKGKRIIPMLDEVRKALLKEKELEFVNGKSKVVIDGYTDFIFKNRFGNVHTPMTINRAIKRIYTLYNKEEQDKAKKENREPLLIPHFSVHVMRHTFCTRFCENETNVKVIQEIMGHSDISTTMNIYNHATEDKKKEAINNLNGKIKIS